MTIVSISVNEELLERFDETSGRKGYSTRSEAIRDAMRAFVGDGELEIEGGENIAIISLIYAKGVNRSELIRVQHRFPEIQTMLHTHLDDKNCLEVYILKGEGERLKKLVKEIRHIKAVKRVDFASNASNV